MPKKLIRITTIPLSLEKLLEGQLSYMNQYYQVTAVSAEKERLERYGKDNGVNTFWVEMTRAITPLMDAKAVWKLYNYFKKEEPLIVHTHTPKAGIVGMLAAKLAGVPLRLHTVAGLPLMETTGNKRKLLDFVEKLTYKLATRVYPNSRGLEEIILKEGFAEEEKLKVLGKGSSNGIDTSYFDPSNFSEEDKINIRQELNIPENDLVFIFIGRLVSEKGIDELVAAFKRLQERKLELSLLLVGPFEEELDPISEESKEIIENHPKIFTTGYQADVRPYLAVSNVLAFPSYREGFPNVVMQAGAMGLASIVSDINGCNEIIVEGKNGMIIPVKDEGALFNAMELIAQNEDYRIRLASNSREEICKYYERKEFWQILLKEYKSLEQEYIKS
ncbi:glycosyltransferase family 4 protein [Salegentibacter flavus]|uniref:Glycosyltransferase involved in cell wall bisynthesis n=1 Tax=Salegentibacter flavus TaxID=287099 RepID=A0A1I5BGZ2_9FLAO|nr:glycosyltransferase family 4 protein [Salegentibacter flavus]SFN73985.1 Glycosyltransferase involved in cell wall bisynthesis [Salegentibacter flavus]